MIGSPSPSIAFQDILNREVCSSFYDILVRKEDDVRRKAWAKLVQGLHRFGKEKKAGGPCFAGTQTLGLVDVALIPHAARFYVLSHYRGKDFALDPKDAALSPFFTWNRHVMSLPAVKATLADKDRLLQSYKRYADGSAASKIADAVRSGKSADQHD